MSWYAIEVLATLEICIALESGLTLCILISSSCWTGCKSLLFCQRSQVERTDQWSAAPNPCSFPGKWGIFSHPECNLVSLRCWLKIEKTAYQINCMPMLSCIYTSYTYIKVTGWVPPSTDTAHEPNIHGLLILGGEFGIIFEHSPCLMQGTKTSILRSWPSIHMYLRCNATSEFCGFSMK